MASPNKEISREHAKYGRVGSLEQGADEGREERLFVVSPPPDHVMKVCDAKEKRRQYDAPPIPEVWAEQRDHAAAKHDLFGDRCNDVIAQYYVPPFAY